MAGREERARRAMVAASVSGDAIAEHIERGDAEALAADAEALRGRTLVALPRDDDGELISPEEILVGGDGAPWRIDSIQYSFDAGSGTLGTYLRGHCGRRRFVRLRPEWLRHATPEEEADYAARKAEGKRQRKEKDKRIRKEQQAPKEARRKDKAQKQEYRLRAEELERELEATRAELERVRTEAAQALAAKAEEDSRRAARRAAREAQRRAEGLL